jgi:hypothetical protein
MFACGLRAFGPDATDERGCYRAIVQDSEFPGLSARFSFMSNFSESII